VLEVRCVDTAEELAAVRALIRAHAAALRQHKGTELVLADAAGLPGPYAPPRGRLYLARLEGVPAGCVALHPLDATTGEVKRMFVHDAARRRGVARALMVRLLDDARALGYLRLRLGTLDEMTAAQQLYRSLGFREIPGYRADEPVDTVFFECDLTRPIAGH
jgi:GNAT superfamily N-acetyltransferase